MLAHHLGATDLAVQHGLVEDGQVLRRVGLGQQPLAPVEAGLDPHPDPLLGQPGHVQPEDLGRVGGRLQQAGDQQRMEVPDRRRLLLELHELHQGGREVLAVLRLDRPALPPGHPRVAEEPLHLRALGDAQQRQQRP